MDLSLKTETFGQDDQSWLASEHGTSNARTLTLKISTLTAGTHYPTGHLPSGVAVGIITATGKAGLYNNAASDGTQNLVGFVLTAQKIGTADVVVPVMTHGAVIEANLPFAVNAAAKTSNPRIEWR